MTLALGLALASEAQGATSQLWENGAWSAFGLAVGYGAGRLHCWLATMEHPEDEDEPQRQ